MSEGCKEAIQADEDVVPGCEARTLERVRELERLLGRKTVEVEILQEGSTPHWQQNRPCCRARRYRGDAADIPAAAGTV
jgi:hypothetical protein